METSDLTWQRDDTQLTAEIEKDSIGESRRCLILTIAAHPDATRVGEVAVLSLLLDGFTVGLSRTSPAFFRPGSLARRPLQTNRLSRRPFHLIPEKGGRLIVERRLNRTSLSIHDREVADRCILSNYDLERGLPMVLNGQVLLWLHYAHPQLFNQPALPRLVGESEPMLRLRAEIHRVAGAQMPVLIQGETGTGKELVAHAIHQAGSRQHAPFVAVNMAAVPPALAASELFGAAKGAYTGADREKIGLFAKADGGTLFLDEIGDAAPETQALLLRAVEEREIQPVGSVTAKKVDVRIISATDADLIKEIRGDRFRSPLLHRLAGYRLQLPALRLRRDDIARLFFAFAQDEEQGTLDRPRATQDEGYSWPAPSIMARLMTYSWPGNVRELRNVARRLAFDRTTEVSVRDLHAGLDKLLESEFGSAPARADETGPHHHDAAPLERAVEPYSLLKSSPEARPEQPPIYRRRRFRKVSEVSEQELLKALQTHKWVLKATAAELDISRAGLYRLIEACPSIRKASEIPVEEIQEALRISQGDTDACAARLQVSPAGLKMRLKAIQLQPSAENSPLS